MNRLLEICGPTATGKTDLGVYLAEKLNGEIISADSRQVYRGMTIGTGKEYSDTAKIWGYDLAQPTDEFSVAHFQKFAHKKISEILSHGKLPILVGGTGLYIRAILENIDTTAIPPNELLRAELETKSVEELFTKLHELNPQKALSLNESDKQNPRRLIRALEIAMSNKQTTVKPILYDSLIVGLKSDMSYLENRLKMSIEKRMARGMVKEVTDLLHAGVPLESKAMTATGYREIALFILGKLSEEEATQKWLLSERRYVKRQLTWFNKRTDIHWFDIAKAHYKYEVEEVVKKWENKP